MSPLKVGSVALLLIIITPIILGYAMASEEVETTVSRTNSEENLSELVLNSETPYYVDYSGENNNEWLYSIDASTLVSPNYNATSETTYSYTPIYGDATYSVTTRTPTTTTISADDFSGISDFPSFSTAMVVFTGGNEIYLHVENWGLFELKNGAPLYLAYDSLGTNSYQYVAYGTYSDNTTFTTYFDGISLETPTGFTITYLPLNTGFVSIGTDSSVWSADLDVKAACLKIGQTTAAGTAYTTVTGYVDVSGLLYNNGTLSVFAYDFMQEAIISENWSRVTSVMIAVDPDIDTVSYVAVGEEFIGYADVTQGWKLPESEVEYYWFNGYTNHSIRMFVGLNNRSDFSIGNAYGPWVSIDRSGGDVTVTIDESEPVLLGSYSSVMVEIIGGRSNLENGTISVYGIGDVPPSIGVMPTTYNSVSQEVSTLPSSFDRLYLSSDTADRVSIRIDATGIEAGTFPSTINKNLYLYDLFPNDEKQGLVIDSVGIYGDSLRVANYVYDVDDNTISIVDLDTAETVVVDVVGMKIDLVYSDGTYTAYINGHPTSTMASSPNISFRGEWSLTLHRTVTSEETITSTEWQPGVFSFDKQEFILCMILASVCVFVGLGLMRGVKIGVLAVVCSAAGIIAFMIA